MQNDYLDTQILFHEDDPQNLSGTTVSGKIIFTPKIDLSIEELGYQVVIIAKNKYYNYTNDILLDRKIIFRNKVLKKEENYSYDIEFKSDFSTTFRSENLKLESNIQTIVKLQTSNYLKIRNDYLKKNNLSTFTDTNQLLGSNKTFSLDRSKKNYVIQEKNYNAPNEYQRPWIYFLISSIISVIIIFSLDLSNRNQTLALVLTILFSIFIAPQLYKEYILHSIEINTKQLGENQFGIFLDLTKTWKRIQSVKAEYGIFGSILFEDVQKDMPYEFDMYISPPIEKFKIEMKKYNVLDFPEVNYDFIFDFPKKNLPATFENDSVSFYWEFKITVYFFLGLKSEFVKEIKVKQIPKISTNKNL